ncbi:hypothetical protein [Burkholderia multivorans]|uniref:hypothetical protein n=1 Tax=Burkholderia multivorans TaxID=87883 RepID=UPI0011B2445B|nr:hypothetical protein [Burkholderia multivorans]
MLDPAHLMHSVGMFIVLQREFWPNGNGTGISEVAYAVQDLSVNRVGIFPTRRIERLNEQKCGVRFGETCADMPRRAVRQGMPGRESVKIIVVFHDGATIALTISIPVSVPFLFGFSRISSCNKP